LGSRIRILTANLLAGGADPEAFAGLVQDHGVDIAALQELSRPQAEALATVLPFGSLRPAQTFDGMGIALRRPARESRLRLPDRDAPIAELDPSEWSEINSPLEVMNVHIRAPHLLPPWRTVARRRGQLRGLLEYLDATQDRRQVVVGDFNATPRWPLYRRMASRRVDAVRMDAERRGRRPAPTWGPWPGAPRLLRIDHAFVQGLRVERARVLPLPGSDHSALLIELGV
jgi:endonuclease/exonuclease/phosphatase family metal-dependent hydrolase